MATHYPLTPTVFIINDCSDGHELTKLLKASGCFVMEECNVREAVDTALDFTFKRKPNLILINLEAVINEYPLAVKVLRESGDLHNVPILAMVSITMEEFKHKAYEVGCDDFIFNLIDLEQTKKIMGYLTPRLSRAAA